MNKAEEKVFHMAADFLEEQRRVQNLFFFFGFSALLGCAL